MTSKRQTQPEIKTRLARMNVLSVLWVALVALAVLSSCSWVAEAGNAADDVRVGARGYPPESLTLREMKPQLEKRTKGIRYMKIFIFNNYKLFRLSHVLLSSQIIG